MNITDGDDRALRQEDSQSQLERRSQDASVSVALFGGNLAQCEEDKAELLSQLTKFQAQNEEWRFCYDVVYQQYLQARKDLVIEGSRYKELVKICQESASLLRQQRVELERRNMELEAAELAARELGEMVSNLVLADDIAIEAVHGMLNVTDVILRNKYLELLLGRVRTLAQPDARDAANENFAVSGCRDEENVSGQDGVLVEDGEVAD